MLQWFLRLPPEMQVALLAQAAVSIFGCGVWWGTIRSLKNAVVEVKKKNAEQDIKLEKHGEQLARHDEQIVSLEAAHARRGGR